jgi:hypothetical protein
MYSSIIDPQHYWVFDTLLILAAVPKAALQRTAAARPLTAQLVFTLMELFQLPKAAKVFADTECKQPATM